MSCSCGKIKDGDFLPSISPAKQGGLSSLEVSLQATMFASWFQNPGAHFTWKSIQRYQWFFQKCGKFVQNKLHGFKRAIAPPPPPQSLVFSSCLHTPSFPLKAQKKIIILATELIIIICVWDNEILQKKATKQKKAPLVRTFFSRHTACALYLLLMIPSHHYYRNTQVN